MKNPYETLWLDGPGDMTITADDIKAAYRKRAAEEHPDKGGSPESFKAVNDAYRLLSDPKKRRIFDRTGDANLAATWTATIEGTLAKITNEILDALDSGAETEMGLVALVHHQLTKGRKKLEEEIVKAKASLSRCREAAGHIVYLPSDQYPDVLGDALAVRQTQLLAKIEGLKINAEATNEGIAYLSSFRDLLPNTDA